MSPKSTSLHKCPLIRETETYIHSEVVVSKSPLRDWKIRHLKYKVDAEVQPIWIYLKILGKIINTLSIVGIWPKVSIFITFWGYVSQTIIYHNSTKIHVPFPSKICRNTCLLSWFHTLIHVSANDPNISLTQSRCLHTINCFLNASTPQKRVQDHNTHVYYQNYHDAYYI